MRQDAFEAEQVINGKIKPDLVEVPPMSTVSIKPNLPKKLPQGIGFFMTKYQLEAKQGGSGPRPEEFMDDVYIDLSHRLGFIKTSPIEKIEK